MNRKIRLGFNVDHVATVRNARGEHLIDKTFEALNGVNKAIVHLYNRVLSATEILQNYNSTKTRFGL